MASLNAPVVVLTTTLSTSVVNLPPSTQSVAAVLPEPSTSIVTIHAPAVTETPEDIIEDVFPVNSSSAATTSTKPFVPVLPGVPTTLVTVTATPNAQLPPFSEIAKAVHSMAGDLGKQAIHVIGNLAELANDVVDDVTKQNTAVGPPAVVSYVTETVTSHAAVTTSAASATDGKKKEDPNVQTVLSPAIYDSQPCIMM